MHGEILHGRAVSRGKKELLLVVIGLGLNALQEGQENRLKD